MKIFLYFLTFLIAFILIVGIHEIAHALSARLFSVRIQKISLGFGRPLFKWNTQSGIQWIWSLWPLGGYVQLLNSRIEPKPIPMNQLKYCFDKQPIWIRCCILLAGSIANFLLAIIALFVIFLHGYSVTPPVVQEVVPMSIADKAGLIAGDRFLSFGSHAVDSWQEAGMQIILFLDKKQMPALVKNAHGDLRELMLNLSDWSLKTPNTSLLKSIGIKPQIDKQYKEDIPGTSFLSAIKKAMQNTLTNLIFFIVIIKQVIMKNLPFSLLLGPAGLITISGQTFLEGFIPFLKFIANLSLSVGLINLLPIPGLDGGSLVYALIEKIRGKPISIPAEILFQRLSIILFSIFFIQLVLNDIQRYLNLI